jgi:hypothetical protein
MATFPEHSITSASCLPSRQAEPYMPENTYSPS